MTSVAPAEAGLSDAAISTAEGTRFTRLLDQFEQELLADKDGSVYDKAYADGMVAVRERINKQNDRSATAWVVSLFVAFLYTHNVSDAISLYAVRIELKPYIVDILFFLACLSSIRFFTGMLRYRLYTTMLYKYFDIRYGQGGYTWMFAHAARLPIDPSSYEGPFWKYVPAKPWQKIIKSDTPGIKMSKIGVNLSAVVFLSAFAYMNVSTFVYLAYHDTLWIFAKISMLSMDTIMIFMAMSWMYMAEREVISYEILSADAIRKLRGSSGTAAAFTRAALIRERFLSAWLP